MHVKAYSCALDYYAVSYCLKICLQIFPFPVQNGNKGNNCMISSSTAQTHYVFFFHILCSSVFPHFLIIFHPLHFSNIYSQFSLSHSSSN